MSTPQEKREEIDRLVDALVAVALSYSREDSVLMHNMKRSIAQALYRVAEAEGE